MCHHFPFTIHLLRVHKPTYGPQNLNITVYKYKSQKATLSLFNYLVPHGHDLISNLNLQPHPTQDAAKFLTHSLRFLKHLWKTTFNCPLFIFGMGGR